MCQAYFSLFSTIAKMYTKVSIDHIMPGVKLCDKLSMSADGDPNAILVRSRELEQFTDNAQKAVRELVFQVSRVPA
jgi:3-methyladenine DNA glycosylase Mpg